MPRYCPHLGHARWERIGSPQFVTMELLKLEAKMNLVHVPYKGAGPAITDLIGGQVDVLFDNMPSIIGHIRQGEKVDHYETKRRRKDGTIIDVIQIGRGKA